MQNDKCWSGVYVTDNILPYVKWNAFIRKLVGQQTKASKVTEFSAGMTQKFKVFLAGQDAWIGNTHDTCTLPHSKLTLKTRRWIGHTNDSCTSSGPHTHTLHEWHTHTSHEPHTRTSHEPHSSHDPIEHNVPDLSQITLVLELEAMQSLG